MNNQRKIVLIGAVVIVMVLLVWLLSGGDSSGQKGQRQPFVSSNWSSRFQPFDKKPMGLYLFNMLLSTHIDTNKNIYIIQDWIQLDSIMAADSLPKTYMFVGNNFGLENMEIDSIMSDVTEGSRLFLSYHGLTDNLYPRFFDEYEERFDYTESINVFTGKKKYNMINLFQNDTIATEWKAFGDIEPLVDYRSLSSFMEMDNFIKMKFEKGFVYLHTTPGQFYNYQIKRRDGYRYTTFVLNQIPKDQDVLLLELGRLSDNFGNHDVDDQEGAEGKEDDSYLRLIFQNPSLLIATLLGIFGLILFIFFRSKRTRPIVPHVDKKKDMTLAFAETITSIYFSKRNPYGLLQIQRKNFFDTVQKHFFIDLYRREEDRELLMLAEKSNKSIEEIKSIVNLLETKEAFSVTEQKVSEVAKMKRKFYLDTGIITEKIEERVKDSTMTFRRSLWLPSLMILGGLFLIMFGFYYLIQAIGVGIVLWPIGIVSLALGIIRVSKPFMVIDQTTITYYSPFGRKKVFSRDDLIVTEVKERGVVLNFTENRKLIINNWDLSLFDKKQFDRFISKLHKQEL